MWFCMRASWFATISFAFACWSAVRSWNNCLFLVGAHHVLKELLLDLLGLLPKWFHGCMSVLHDGLHLRLLLVGQVQRLGEEAHPAAFHAEVAVHRRWRRSVSGGLRLRNGAAEHNRQGGNQQTKTKRFHM